MILDADSPSKSPVSSRPTVRGLPATSAPAPHVTDIADTVFRGAYSGDTRSDTIYSETTPLLYHRGPQSMYDDLQPPAYDDINGSAQKTSAGRRRRIQFAVGFLIILLAIVALFASQLRKSSTTPTQPPRDPVNEPTIPDPPSLPPPPLPLPQLPHLPDPSTPQLPPTSGRTDLCRPWAYVALDSRPIERIVYTVPSLLPIHIESGSICPTSSGQLEICANSDEPISGKLQVLGEDIDLPQIEVSLRRGADDGLENISVCLTQKNDQWVLGLYVWGDEFTPLSQRLTPSASILVKLPYSQVHTLSTNLDYFTQNVGPNVLTKTNALTFDTLEFRSKGRGGVQIQNVTVGTMHANVQADNVVVQDTHVTRLLRLQSEIGLLIGFVTLVHQGGSRPVYADVQSTFGTIELDAILEYSAQPKTTPEFDINLYSKYSPVVAYIRDPRGSELVAAQGSPSVLPIIYANMTSYYALAQASVPMTYHGSIDLSSEYAAIATNDRAKGLSGRTVSWKERVGTAYGGVVEWTINGATHQAGRVTVSTQFATARLMLFGLKDKKTDLWQDEGTEIAYNLPSREQVRIV